MIFVTVGTHEQQFNRLIREIDALKEKGKIIEDVVVQTGFSDYEPKHCTHRELYSFDEMQELADRARIIITHGGPASFIMALQRGKVPIVVPRQKKYKEHVNDHQVSFVRTVYERYQNILVVEDISKLGEFIRDYESLIRQIKTADSTSNNENFNEGLLKIIGEL